MKNFLFKLAISCSKVLGTTHTSSSGSTHGGGGGTFGDTSSRLKATASKVQSVLTNIVGPCLSVLGTFAVIYVIFLGVQYAKSESDEKRAENKKRMINTLIGAIVMILLITLCYAIKWETLIPQMFGKESD